MRKNTPARNLLLQARKRFTQKQIARYLDVVPKTISRWESGEIETPMMIIPALRHQLNLDIKQSENSGEFTFIDLFAGIGGIRMGFEVHGGKCVFTSEWNKYSQMTYSANFRSNHEIIGDITKFPAAEIPNHDVLLAGFPCQPFSIAGVSKKISLGRAHGFACEAQGTLFFDVARILKEKRPKAFLLENVKNLISHDKGRTFEVIRRTLKDELGYSISWKIIDGQHFVPQHRERILIIGFREPSIFTWDNLRLPAQGPRLDTILHPENGSEEAEPPYTTTRLARVDPKYTLSDKLWNYLQEYSKKHKAKGNGFGFGLFKPEDIARTLSARYYKDGSEILIYQRGKNPRRLTPRECARLMGFDSKDLRMNIPVSDTQAYKQFGNSVIVPVIREVARIMKPSLMSLNAAREGLQGETKPLNAAATVA